MREKPFLVVLLSVVFIAMGVLGVLMAMLYIGAGLSDEMQMLVVLTALVGTGYIVAGYGLFKGARWGWMLALAFTILNILVNIVVTGADYLTLFVDALIFVLLLVTAKYYGVKVFGKITKPVTATPSPSSPIAVSFVETRREKRFVRKKH